MRWELKICRQMQNHTDIWPSQAFTRLKIQAINLISLFNMILFFQHNLLKISEIIANFAVTDRLAEAPVWG